MTTLQAATVKEHGTVYVATVENEAGNRAFIDFPYQFYRNDPNWVPPLRKEEVRRWSLRNNTSLKSRWVCRFLARRGRRVVGRIAAMVDETFAARWEPHTGFFGFFECSDDPEAARALLDAAERVLRRQGMTRVIGPINLTTHDETGILVEGFESPPTVQSPYNPPYYASLLGGAGYIPYRDYHAYLWTPAYAPGQAVRRLVQATVAGRGMAGGITIRALDLRRWDSEVRTVFELYNASFAHVWGFVPIGWDEFLQRATLFRPFVRPELVLLAESGGEPVGFVFTLPDINEALACMGGRLWPFGCLRLAWRVPRIRSARCLLVGVRPGYTGRGVGALLAFELATVCQRLGLHRLDLSLVQAANERVRRVIAAFGCPSVKTFRLYTNTLFLPDGEGAHERGMPA